MPARGLVFSVWFWVGLWAILPGVLVLAYGWLRRRRVGDHPHCRKCEYDLFGLPESSTACPECGSSLARPKAKTIGLRRRRRSVVSGGLLVTLAGLGLSGVTGYRAVSQVPWIELKPLWLLERDIVSDDQTRHDAGVVELSRRLPVFDRRPLFRRLGDKTLRRTLADRAPLDGWEDQILSEMLRRDGARFAQDIRDRIQARAAAGQGAWNSAVLTLETALRRAEGKPDPIQIQIDPPAERTVTFPELPDLAVALVNVDVDKRPIRMQLGGDYRSGRQARWRIEATDADGRPVPLIDRLGFSGGGLSSIGDVEPGKRLETTLRLGSFLRGLPPGTYMLRIFYHDQITLADREEIRDLIMCSSPPLKVTVLPRTITVTPKQREQSQRLARQLEGTPVKVVEGAYGPWAYSCVKPESPAGRLLEMGPAAVPALLDALRDPDLTAERRAWILAMLYSITGANNPMMRFRYGIPQDAVLGAVEWVQGSRPMSWTTTPVAGTTGGSTASRSGSSGGTINESAQKEFAKRWEPWVNYIRVQTLEPPATTTTTTPGQ